MKNFNSTSYVLNFLNDLKEFEREFEHIRDQISISFNDINWTSDKNNCERFLIRIHTPIYDDRDSDSQARALNLLYRYVYSHNRKSYARVIINRYIYDDNKMREYMKCAGHVVTSLLVYHKGENLTLNNKFLRRLKFLIG